MLFSKTTGQGGNTIIFVHGNSQNHTVWAEVFAHPSLKNCIKIAIDLPGHGQSFRSSAPDKDYTLRGMALHLQNFANQYSKQGYVLVGSSLATNYIAERAHGFENCKGAFLIGPSLIGENITPTEILHPNPNFGVTFTAQPSDAELSYFLDDEAYHLSAALKQQLKTMYWDTDPALRTTLGAAVAQQQYGDEIGNLWAQNLPIALVYGANEKIIFTDYMHGMNLKMWHDEIIKIPKAGHFCQFDEPALLAQMIADFTGECFK